MVVLLLLLMMSVLFLLLVVVLSVLLVLVLCCRCAGVVGVVDVISFSGVVGVVGASQKPYNCTIRSKHPPALVLPWRRQWLLLNMPWVCPKFGHSLRHRVAKLPPPQGPLAMGVPKIWA
jgi:hypothetical protein